jgi:peptide/nickel transport system substrate-binding protein
MVVRGVAAGAAVTGIASLAGCATPAAVPTVAQVPAAPASAPPAAASAATPTPAGPAVKYGGAFRYPYTSATDVPNLDPALVPQLGLPVQGPGVAYSKLLQLRADVKPEDIIATGDLAESWTQPDDNTYIFKLRPNAKFHNIAPVNGRAVVAEDIKYSFERQIALKTNAGLLSGMRQIEVVDPQTLKLSLDKPDADFLASVADLHNKIVAREVVELKGDLKEGPTIGSGPWIFEKWEKDNLASVVKNPDYFIKGVPYVDRLEFPRVPDLSKQQAAFRTKQIDFLPSRTPEEAETLSKISPDVVLDSFKAPQGVFLGANTGKPPFNDIRVRQAIFKAIDKQAIMDAVYSGKAWYFAGVNMPSDDVYLAQDEMKTLYQRDLAAARRLLADAGVAPGRELRTVVLDVGTTYSDTAQLLKSQLAEIGFNLRLEVVPSAMWTTLVWTQHAHDLTVGAITPVFTANGNLLNTMHSTGGRNASAINDPKLDAMIEQQAAMSRDPAARKKALQEIQRYVINSAHQMTLAGVFSLNMRWKNVQNLFLLNTDEAYTRVWLNA